MGAVVTHPATAPRRALRWRRRADRPALAVGALALAVVILVGGWRITDSASTRASVSQVRSQAAQVALDQVVALTTDAAYPPGEVALLGIAVAHTHDARLQLLERDFVAALRVTSATDARHVASVAAARARRLEDALGETATHEAANAASLAATASRVRTTVRTLTVVLLVLLGLLTTALDRRFQRRRDEDERRRQRLERQLATLVEQSGDAIITVNGGTVTTWNPAAERLLGYPEATILGAPVALLDTEGAVERNVEIWARARDGATIVAAMTEMRHLDGRGIPVEVTASPLSDEAGHATAVSAVVRDATERRARERRLATAAATDPLTGVANHASFTSALAAARDEARTSGSTAALLFIDLDRFKEVNDTYGHDVGDALLRVVAERVRDALRPDDFVARPGGDEFVAVCRRVHGTPEARELARRVAERVAEPLQIGEVTLATSVSIGVALSDAADDADGWLRAADQAMYRAKREGRSRVHVEV